jgi:hypothetical protein
MQIHFGLMNDFGPYHGQYESKKIDLIRLEWVRPPRKFSVLTWKPGYSWIVRQSFDNFNGKVTEIRMKGQEAAAVMLILEGGFAYPELGNKVAYALKNIYIGYNAMKVKRIFGCGSKGSSKLFDFDQQGFRLNLFTPQYDKEMKRVSISYERMIGSFKDLKKQMTNTNALKQMATDYLKKLEKFKKSLSQNIKKVQDFRVNNLKKFQNSQLQDLLSNDADGKSFKKNLTQKYKGADKLGTRNNPAIDCFSLISKEPNANSGFYYIKPSCAPKDQKPLRVFCDFNLFGQAVDIYIFNDNSKVPNPNLSYLKIEDYLSIRLQCAKLGLYPIEIKNRQMVQRIYELLTAMGYDLSQSKGIPLGYDYTCKTNKCSRVIKSLNNHLSEDIINFFSNPNSKDSTVVNPGPFVGFGFSSGKYAQISFTKNTPISALVCSTNHFKSDMSDMRIKELLCESVLNSDVFKPGLSYTVTCPIDCTKSQAKVYGNGYYHGSSSICKAALHGEALLPGGRMVTVKVFPPMANDYIYTGSVLNGVQSDDKMGGDMVNAFAVEKYDLQCPIDAFNKKPSSFLETGNLIEELVSQNDQQIPSNFNPAEYGINMDQFKEYISQKKLNGQNDNESNLAIDNMVSAANDPMEPQNNEINRMADMIGEPNGIDAMGQPAESISQPNGIDMMNQSTDMLNQPNDGGDNLGNFSDGGIPPSQNNSDDTAEQNSDQVNSMDPNLNNPMTSQDYMDSDMSELNNSYQMTNMDMAQQNYDQLVSSPDNNIQMKDTVMNTDFDQELNDYKSLIQQENMDQLNPDQQAPVDQMSFNNPNGEYNQNSDQANTDPAQTSDNSENYAFKENMMVTPPIPPLPGGMPKLPGDLGKAAGGLGGLIPNPGGNTNTNPASSPSGNQSTNAGSSQSNFAKTFQDAAGGIAKSGIYYITFSHSTCSKYWTANWHK